MVTIHSVCMLQVNHCRSVGGGTVRDCPCAASPAQPSTDQGDHGVDEGEVLPLQCLHVPDQLLFRVIPVGWGRAGQGRAGQGGAGWP